jgi:hypothetical protein
MALDKLLQDNATWLEQTLKRPVFDKVDDKTIKFPEEQRQRRMADVKTRIADLSRRKQEVVASYERAIALEEQEFKALSAQIPVAAPQEVTPEKPKGSKP